MRKIKFRGKKIDNNQWIEGFYFKTEVGCFVGSYNEEEQVFKETIGQFTGLTDKNGKEIFEGDILDDECGEIGVVIWVDSIAQFSVCVGKELYMLNRGYSDRTLKLQDSYVLGNIHDNPELIK